MGTNTDQIQNYKHNWLFGLLLFSFKLIFMFFWLMGGAEGLEETLTLLY